MQFTYKPKQTNLERFGFKIYNLLVENFSASFFVGGTSRDMFLGKTVKDFDIATVAKPEEVRNLLNKHGYKTDQTNQKYGVIKAKQGKRVVEITTLRKDIKTGTRYPKVTFIKSPKQDSERRDFTINALYYSPKQSKIVDFHKGLLDLKAKKIRCIGNPEIRFEEDPLRIIRANRFAISLNFAIEKKTEIAMKKNIQLIKQLTASKQQKEFKKLKSKKQQIKLQNTLYAQGLDEDFLHVL